jgi:hypothetical protein
VSACEIEDAKDSVADIKDGLEDLDKAQVEVDSAIEGLDLALSTNTGALQNVLSVAQSILGKSQTTSVGGSEEPSSGSSCTININSVCCKQDDVVVEPPVGGPEEPEVDPLCQSASHALTQLHSYRIFQQYPMGSCQDPNFYLMGPWLNLNQSSI